MKIFVLSDVASHGGAAFIANSLASIWKRDHQVIRRYMVRRSGDNDPSSAVPANRVMNYAVHDLLAPGPLKSSISRIYKAVLIDHIKKSEPDIINLHNLHAANVDPELVLRLQEIAPVFWTLHDMWSFTGRCANSGACDNYIAGCDKECRTANERPALRPEQIKPAWIRKKKMLDNSSRLTGISPSGWLSDLAQKGLWRGLPFSTINNGIDLNKFRPIDKKSASEALGIGKNRRPIVACYSAPKGDPFKTPEYLSQAINSVDAPLTVLSFGPAIPDLDSKHTLIDFGIVKNTQLLPIIYSAADVYLHSAQHENFPTVLLEAMACGLPSVAFATGGIPEIVERGKTGLLAEERSGKSLGVALTDAIDLSRSIDQSEACIEKARRLYNIEDRAVDYVELFRRQSGRKI